MAQMNSRDTAQGNYLWFLDLAFLVYRLQTGESCATANIHSWVRFLILPFLVQNHCLRNFRYSIPKRNKDNLPLIVALSLSPTPSINLDILQIPTPKVETNHEIPETNFEFYHAQIGADEGAHTGALTKLKLVQVQSIWPLYSRVH